MPLLSLAAAQQAGYGPGWADYQRRQQQQRPVQYAAAQPQQPPQMPSLTGAPTGQPMGPDPFAPAPMAPPVTAAPKEPMTQQQGVQGGFWGGFNKNLGNWAESPLLQMGLSLMGNAQNGGNWSGVGQDMRQMSMDQRQRQQMENEARRMKTADARDETIFGRQQTQWGFEDRQRADWEAAVQGEQDPQRQVTLRAMGPQGYGDWMSGEQNRAFQSRENQLNRDNDRRVAATRSANENSLGRYFQSMDAQTIGDLNQQSAQLQATGLPQLYALRDTINQAGLSLTGQPIDYNNRITLGRYFNGSSGERQTLEVWRAQILGPALESLRGLGAMSERELDAAMNSFANPNMTLGAAQQLIDQRIQLAQRRVDTANHANSYFQEYGGLTGAGPGWPSYLAERIGSELPQPGAGRASGGGTPPALAPTFNAGPSPQDIQTLRQNSSAERRRQFDEVYGRGASERALRGQVQGRGGASRPIF